MPLNTIVTVPLYGSPQQCITARAKRDNSVLFKSVLANDAPTQAVIADYRPRIQKRLESVSNWRLDSLP